MMNVANAAMNTSPARRECPLHLHRPPPLPRVWRPPTMAALTSSEQSRFYAGPTVAYGARSGGLLLQAGLGKLQAGGGGAGGGQLSSGCKLSGCCKAERARSREGSRKGVMHASTAT